MNKEINWAMLRNQASIAAMQIIMEKTRFDVDNYSAFAPSVAKFAVEYADALIAELRKQPFQDTTDKKEVAIGETIEYKGEHFLCVGKTDADCSGCAFLAKDDDCMYSGRCYKEYRSDGKNVIFLNK